MRRWAAAASGLALGALAALAGSAAGAPAFEQDCISPGPNAVREAVVRACWSAESTGRAWTTERLSLEVGPDEGWGVASASARLVFGGPRPRTILDATPVGPVERPPACSPFVNRLERLRAPGIAVRVDTSVLCGSLAVRGAVLGRSYAVTATDPRAETDGPITLAGTVLTRAPRGSRGPDFVFFLRLCRPAGAPCVAYELADRTRTGGTRRGIRVAP